MMSSSYFEVRNVRYRGGSWHYADATHELVIILGELQDTETLVLIRQYRPAVNGWVISPPMGAFVAGKIGDLIEIARREAEGETGLVVANIRPLWTMARSPGLTSEKAHYFYAIYSGERCVQILHPQEEIELMLVERSDLEPLLVAHEQAGDIADAALAFLLEPQRT